MPPSPLISNPDYSLHRVVLTLAGVGVASAACAYIFRKRDKSTRKRETLDEIGLKYVGDSTYKGKNYQGGDKTSMGQGFTHFYDKLLSEVRDKPNVQVLEIGIWYGKSLAMWADYFKEAPGATIYGIDISLSHYKGHLPSLHSMGAFQDTNPVVKTFQVDTSSSEFPDFCKSNLPSLDVIIDDGCHLAESQYQIFQYLFSFLSPGGLYIVEDIEDPGLFLGPKYFGHIVGGVIGTPAYFNSQAVTNPIEKAVSEEKALVESRYAKLERDIMGLRSRLDTMENDPNTNQQTVEKVRFALESKEKLFETLPVKLSSGEEKRYRESLRIEARSKAMITEKISEIFLRENVLVIRKAG